MLGGDSPALKVTSGEAIQYFSVGPPYVMTGRDIKRLVPLWAELISKVGALEIAEHGNLGFRAFEQISTFTRARHESWAEI